jgi:hypothetical protein
MHIRTDGLSMLYGSIAIIIAQCMPCPMQYCSSQWGVGIGKGEASLALEENVKVL